MRVLLAVCVMAILTATTAYGQYYAYTTLTLDPIPGWTYTGETITFTGTLTSGDSPLPGRTVVICEDDPFIPDECLASGTTNHAGRFSIEWTAKAGIVETDFDIYAEFDGDRQYFGDQSPRQIMSVYTRGGALTLDPIPTSAAFGEAISLSGTLTLDGRSSEGAIIYIQDEDTFNPDDLLTTAYVDSSGRFTTYWVVEDVDPTYTIEIRAVFEGNALYNRLATPIQKLRAYVDPLAPAPSPTEGEGYMELYRSLDFERAPRILIAPSPDSYDAVRGHIAPVREGILLLTSMLEREYGTGNWDVDFEVVEPGDNFADHEPDIIVSLVTRDDDSRCGDWWGWAFTTHPKPVPTVVCSVDGRTNEGVAATAAHEFIHAIGVGHTFNIRGDMMCSVEEGAPTCPASSRSSRASGLNLAAIVAVYGTDGFQNPNNRITRGERLTLADYQSGNHLSPSPNQGLSAIEHNTGEIHADQEQYRPGEGILLDGFYLDAYDGSSTVVVTDPYGDAVDALPIDVADGWFEAYFYGYYLPGTYAAWLYDGRGEFVASTTFEVADGSDAGLYGGFTYTDYILYEPGEPVLISGFYWDAYDGPSSIMVVDPDGYVVDRISVDVEDGFFDATTSGHRLPGAYAVWMFDNQDNFVSSTAFHIAYPQAASTYEGYAYAEFWEYDQGEVVTVEGYYWDSHYLSSSIGILDPDGDLVNYLYLDAIGSDFNTSVGRYYEPGIYTVLFYDHLGSLVSSSSFRIVDPAYASLYTASVYTDYIWYYPGDTVLIEGFHQGTYDGPSSMTVVDPEGYVVDELYVDAPDGFFAAETAGHYQPGAYAIWLYDDLEAFVSSTAFHIVGIDEP